GSSAKCLDSIKSNQLALSLATTELISYPTASINFEIKNIIQNDKFWNKVQNLLIILKILVDGIIIFEGDTSYLSQFYKWYKNLETNKCQSLANDIMTTVSDFVKKYYSEFCTKIYSQLLEYINHSASKLTQFAKRILTILTSSVASEQLNSYNQVNSFNNFDENNLDKFWESYFNNSKNDSELFDNDESETESNIDF
ncbi:5802_t:CDS:2, partial [Scutellospora calospora]